MYFKPALSYGAETWTLTRQALASLYVVRQYITSSIGKQPLEWLTNKEKKQDLGYRNEIFERNIEEKNKRQNEEYANQGKN